MYYRWLLGNSLAHLERAKGTPHEDAERVVLKAVSLAGWDGVGGHAGRV